MRTYIFYFSFLLFYLYKLCLSFQAHEACLKSSPANFSIEARATFKVKD